MFPNPPTYIRPEHPYRRLDKKSATNFLNFLDVLTRVKVVHLLLSTGLVAVLVLETVVNDALDDVVGAKVSLGLDGLENTEVLGHLVRIVVVGAHGVHLGVGTRGDNLNVEYLDEVGSNVPRGADDNFIHILATEDVEDTLVEVHNRVVLSLVGIDGAIVVDTDVKEGSEGLGLH